MKQTAFLTLVVVLTGLPVLAQNSIESWSTIEFVDAFGEVTGHGSVSPAIGTVQQMSFPYQSTTARIVIDCERAWIRFNESPNLVGGAYIGSNGWQRHRVLLRFDSGNSLPWSVDQAPGGTDLIFANSQRVVALITTLTDATTIAIALEWYGQGSVAFRWTLSRATDAIDASCE